MQRKKSLIDTPIKPVYTTNMRAKKSFGQNFLRSKKAIHDMIGLAGVGEGERVVEVGPGKGVLTEQLLITGAKIVAIEMDPRMTEYLHERFKTEIANGRLHLYAGDVLDDSLWGTICQEQHLSGEKYKVVANIPYYITGAILKHFLQTGPQPLSMTLLVQKEVAHQIIARDNKEGILSISVKVYGVPKSGGTVKRNLFSPAPKVDSAILHVAAISKQNFSSSKEERSFFEFLHAGMGTKRKTLLNNLARSLGKQKDQLLPIFLRLNIMPSARPENLSVKDWLALSRSKL